MSKHGNVAVTRGSGGRTRFEIEIRHDELNKFQIVRGEDEAIVWQKAFTRMKQWDLAWETQKKAVDSRAEKYRRALAIRQGKEYAAERTREADALWNALMNLFRDARRPDERLGWEVLKNNGEFPHARPKKRHAPPEPQKPSVGPEPRRDASEYVVRLGLLDRFSAQRRDQRWKEAAERFTRDHEAWEQARSLALAEYEVRMKAREQVIRQIDTEHRQAVDEWEARRAHYLNERDAHNAVVDEKHNAYRRGDPGAILDYCDLILSYSDYPHYFPQSFVLDYEPESKLIIVDYQLPLPTDLPTLEELRYSKSKNTFEEKHITEKDRDRRYDRMVFDIALRSAFELFTSDEVQAIDQVIFNGFVRSENIGDPDQNAYLISLKVRRDDLVNVDPREVDTRALLKKLKPLTSGKPSELKPITPELPAMA